MSDQPTAQTSNSAGIAFGFLKYIVPVVASVLSFWLHNKQTVKKVKKTGAAIESGLENAR